MTPEGVGNSTNHEVGHLVPALAVELSAATFWRSPAPLLEEERHTGREALVADLHYPLIPELSRPGSRLAADNHPVNPVEIQLAHGSDQRLDRQEPGGDGNPAEVVDTVPVRCVLDADSHPDIGRPTELGGHLGQCLRAFRQGLPGLPG